jgi:hypothetical protein
MTGKFSKDSLAAVLALGFLALGCEPGGVGDPCTPEDEYTQEFSGFSVGEVNVESRSFQCETRICLVNHFQGRVSCPYGQITDDVPNPTTGVVGKPGNDPARCRIPGTDGLRTDDAGNTVDDIKVPVEAQLEDRRADKAVYCSCRCKGPDENARYCECPSGYKCEELVKELGLSAAGQLAGSYCVRDNTGYDPTSPPSPATCQAAAGNCDDEGNGKNPCSGDCP